jgi:hypothetical protein
MYGRPYSGSMSYQDFMEDAVSVKAAQHHALHTRKVTTQPPSRRLRCAMVLHPKNGLEAAILGQKGSKPAGG